MVNVDTSLLNIPHRGAPFAWIHSTETPPAPEVAATTRAYLYLDSIILSGGLPGQNDLRGRHTSSIFIV